VLETKESKSSNPKSTVLVKDTVTD
jgi:hypothetical protein